MKKILAVAGAGLVVLGSVTACTSAELGTLDLQVFAASSTRVVNEDIQDAAAELEPPLELVFNNAGSGTLVTQLAEGAPADVLITADTASMEQAVEDGSVVDPVEFLENSMVMIVPADNPADISSIEDLSGDIDLVLCDPSVPCGAVSEALIADNDLELDPVSLESAVGDVVGKVTNGEADAGWVYLTDAAAAGDQVEVIDIPGAHTHSNSLWIAPTVEAQPEALSLIELLTSQEFAPRWESAGFKVIAP